MKNFRGFVQVSRVFFEIFNNPVSLIVSQHVAVAYGTASACLILTYTFFEALTSLHLTHPLQLHTKLPRGTHVEMQCWKFHYLQVSLGFMQYLSACM